MLSLTRRCLKLFIPRLGFLGITGLLLVSTVLADANLGLPRLSASTSANQFSALGKRLFFDTRLSIDNSQSCGTCHVADQGFTQNEISTPLGLHGQAIKRNTPTLLNVAFMDALFLDGRELTLEDQIWSPLLSPREMGNLSIDLVVQKLHSIESYVDAFGLLGLTIDAASLGQLIARYERSLIAADSPFDRWYFQGDTSGFTPDAIEGFAIFNRHGCSTCHTIGQSDALFTDQLFHNTGLGKRGAMLKKPNTLAKQPTADEMLIDLGRFEVTGNPADRWRFRTPSLRNIARTAPYMHDGSIKSLTEVVENYMIAGYVDDQIFDIDQDPRLLPFTLDDAELAHLIEFLHTLTSPHVGRLADDANPALTEIPR